MRHGCEELDSVSARLRRVLMLVFAGWLVGGPESIAQESSAKPSASSASCPEWTSSRCGWKTGSWREATKSHAFIA